MAQFVHVFELGVFPAMLLLIKVVFNARIDFFYFIYGPWAIRVFVGIGKYV